MRFYVCISAALAAIVFSSCTKQADTLQQQIDDLSSGRIATLEEQQDSIQASIVLLTAADAALTEYVASLEAEIGTMDTVVAQDRAAVAAMRQTVNAVKASQAALQQSVADLNAYVATGFDALRGWASGTFVTLEQYDALCQSLAKTEQAVEKNAAAIDSLRGSMVSECRIIVKEAVKNVENEIKGWVNDRLTAYWTIAQTQARLDSLGAVEKANLAEAYDSIGRMKDEVTAAYKEAITTAIDDYDGVVTKKIDAAIKAASDTLDVKLAAFDSRLAAAEKNLATLLARVQSIAPIPYWSDGALKVNAKTGSPTPLSFEITPSAAADTLVRRWAEVSAATGVKDTIFTVEYVTTATKGASNAATLIPVTDVAFNDGVVTVTVDQSVLPSAFWSGTSGISAVLCISGEGNERSSEYFVLKK